MMMIMGHLLHHISHFKPTLKSSCKFCVDCINNVDKYSTKPTFNWSTNLISVAIAVALVAPLPSSAILFTPFNPKSSPTTTPFSQAQNLPTGLENGKIRSCPAINPGCISSNPRSSNFSFP